MSLVLGMGKGCGWFSSISIVLLVTWYGMAWTLVIEEKVLNLFCTARSELLKYIFSCPLQIFMCMKWRLSTHLVVFFQQIIWKCGSITFYFYEYILGH